MGILNSTSCFIFSLVVTGSMGTVALAQHDGHHGDGDHGAHQATLPEAPEAARLKGEQVIKVKGMVCEICAAGIKKKLLKEKEVKSVDVKIKEHEVKVVYKDPAKTLSRARLGELLKEAGYELN